MPLSDDDEAVQVYAFLASNAFAFRYCGGRTGSRGLVVLINQGLLADHGAKGAVNRQLIAGERLHRNFWRRKGKLIFLEIEFPL
ncbi:hypothetical protein AWE74_11755 [Escherichia coli]|nr:hypothetical protein RG40_21060 [Escherichia coli]EFO0603326.1 hypothetical protein [Escherichia coli]EFO3044558.1 hypothetical protein [Escherichia coli]EFO3498341.1 hypothetical protein [Escherichia coli]EFO3513104.1 hypothetical protein [Escherichia coli]